MQDSRKPYAALRDRQRRFLLCFEACASITQAARWAKVTRQAHYEWMDDPAYVQAFRYAEPRAQRTLEDEAVRRAREGTRRAVRYKGKIVGWEMEFSDVLMNTLLKADPKFRERVEHTGTIELDVAQRIRDRRAKLLEINKPALNGQTDARSKLEP